ncbi:hypothetical protein P389DRAFT_209105 [Cystobasidium minutum MCA 4210]|uniref:uncharacterized protein n=1 Tax=Cystobasidium minutum MCA 4210 TaxID=1397322 RepID=UPI0034CE1342|eukprot:jgi/Rhomi1/209105/estExt_Genemark1.C_2_t20409
MSDPVEVGSIKPLADKIAEAGPVDLVPPARVADDAEDKPNDEADFGDDEETKTVVEESTVTEDRASPTPGTARTRTRTIKEDEDSATTSTVTSSSAEVSSSTKKSSSSSSSVASTSSEPTSTSTSTTEEEETTTSEVSTPAREPTTSIETRIKSTPRETPMETVAPTKLPGKHAEKEDGLGTGTTIGIALAAVVGVGILLVIIGGLLKWKQKRTVRKRTAGLANFTDINDFADSNTKKDPIDLANEKAARPYAPSNSTTIPVTPPYRPDIRQAQKRNSWVDNRGHPEEEASFGDYTVPPAAAIHGRGAVDMQPVYAPPRPNMPLPGMFGTPPSVGALDPTRAGVGYGNPGPSIPMRQDSFASRAAGGPVRNRHFPPAPGRSYSSENPYPYVPTGHH